MSKVQPSTTHPDRSFTITPAALIGLILAGILVATGFASWTVDPGSQTTIESSWHAGLGWATLTLGVLTALAVLSHRVRDVALLGVITLIVGGVAANQQPDTLDGNPVDPGLAPMFILVVGLGLLVWSGVMQRRGRV